jgi:hypothetical protein
MTNGTINPLMKRYDTTAQKKSLIYNHAIYTCFLYSNTYSYDLVNSIYFSIHVFRALEILHMNPLHFLFHQQ